MTVVYAQAGTIPFRIFDNRLEVLLISTSSGKNLTIPKGIIDPGFTATETALNESYEEAGVEGRLLTPIIGNYRFQKWGGCCVVDVYAMRVSRLLDEWPEAYTRRRFWTEYQKAAHQVKHAGLGQLILRLPDHLNGPASGRCSA